MQPPDGKKYMSVFGTLKPHDTTMDDYIEIGNMMISTSQIKYVIRTDGCELGFVPQTEQEKVYEAVGIYEHIGSSLIYNADITHLHTSKE